MIEIQKLESWNLPIYWFPENTGFIYYNVLEDHAGCQLKSNQGAGDEEHFAHG